MFVYWAIKHYKELWGLHTWLGQDAWEVRGLMPLSKQCGSRFAKICSGNRRSCPESWTYRPNRCCASSGTINTQECNGTSRDTSLLPLWRRSDGQEQSVTSSGTLRTGMKASSSRIGKSSPSRSSTTTRIIRFMFKCPVRWGKHSGGADRPSPCLCHGLVGDVPTGGDTSSFLRERGETGPQCIKRTCYKELWNILTQASSVVMNGSSTRTQLLPTRPKQLRSGCRWMRWPSSLPRIGPQGVQTSTPWTINYGLFQRTWHARSVTTAWGAWWVPSWKQWQRSHWGRCMWQKQSGQSVSRLASRQRVSILSDIIIDENLKLSQTNLLPWKVNVLFYFPSRSHCNCNRTYGKNRYVYIKKPIHISHKKREENVIKVIKVSAYLNYNGSNFTDFWEENSLNDFPPKTTM